MSHLSAEHSEAATIGSFRGQKAEGSLDLSVMGAVLPYLDAARAAELRFIAVLSGEVPREAFIREGVPEDHILERLADSPKLITE